MTALSPHISKFLYEYLRAIVARASILSIVTR